jgi:hypothetical protein
MVGDNIDMAKTWEQMTQAEKIEDLRRDMIRLFDAYNDPSRRLAAGSAHLGQVATIASKAARAVEVKHDDQSQPSSWTGSKRLCRAGGYTSTPG